MHLNSYDPIIHKEAVLDLLSKRGMAASLADDLPSIGLVVQDGKTIVAMGFLRRMEGNYGMLDSYITDPHETSDYRDAALDMITAWLIDYARSIKLNKLLAFSAYDSIYDRALRHGFGAMPHKFAMLDLGQ